MAGLRLKKICNLVDENSIVADIGTDHGIIPIELSKNHIAKKIIATDISEDSLEKLEQKLIYNSNIVNIETRVSDGLDCFNEFEVDTIIISGMGGILIKEILDKYDEKRFVLEKGKIDLTTNVELITAFAIQNGLLLNNKKQTILNFTFYPTEYFCPKNNRTLELQITDNTYAIHHFAGSWISSKNRYNQNIKKMLGPRFTALLLKLTDKFKIT